MTRACNVGIIVLAGIYLRRELVMHQYAFFSFVDAVIIIFSFPMTSVFRLSFTHVFKVSPKIKCCVADLLWECCKVVMVDSAVYLERFCPI